jgi:hypothetical protein
MKTIHLIACAAALLASGCASSRPQAAANQPTAGSTGSETARYGAAPTIDPSNPAYTENGAPRPGQPSGQDTAGAPSDTGNYAPLQHREHRGGGFQH